MRFIALLILTLFLSGCYTPLTSLGEWEKDKDTSIHEVLQEVFTPEAYELIKDIPVYRGPLPGHALACGTTFFSRAPMPFEGRAIILRETNITDPRTTRADMVGVLIHEYIHHIEDLSLDGEFQLFDYKDFEAAYQECFHHGRYKGICLTVEPKANKWVTNNFGISELSEYIAYTGQIIYKQGCTPSLRRVYSHVLRKPANVKDVP